MKILVVDDESPARQRLCDLVDELELGIVVGEAGNGCDALAKADYPRQRRTYKDRF